MPLVRAKLRPPRPLRTLVRRAGPAERLAAAVADAVVVVVQGPSGIGKTSLLTMWAAAESRPVAWLNVDAGDNDPARFWSHVAGALGVVPSGAAGSDLFVGALIDWVVASEHRPILVLDEYEHVTHAQVHRQLDLLIQGCGDRLTTVIASRVRPPLRLDRLALPDRLAVFTWSDLRMDEGEAERLFAEGFGLRLPADRVASLVRSTDGWAGGLAFAGARGGAEVGELLADHLVEYVWAGLAPELREFLLDTAVLERFCVPLAEAVHDRGPAADLIDRLYADGVFLLREEDGRWFRCQRLFRWALARRLAALDPVREQNAHRAAARWHLDQGSRDEAIEHSLRAGDHELAVGLIDEVFGAQAAAGRLVTLARWLESLPDAAITSSSESFTDRALDLWCALGRPVERDRWRLAAGRELTLAGPAREADVWQLCLPRERGDLALALRQGREVVGRRPWASPMASAQARISVARSLLVAGRPAECRQLLAEAGVGWEPPADLSLVMHALTGLAHYREKDLERAREQALLAERAHAACPIPPRAPEHTLLQAATGMPDGLVRLRELVESSPGLGPDHSMKVFALLILGQLDPEGAAERLAAADALLASFPSPLGLIDFRNELGAAAGSAPQAAELLSERELAVLQYLRSDLSLKEIAAHLYVSVNTVKTHTRHVYRKLGIAGRHELSPPEPS